MNSELIYNIDLENVPTHIAIIMDGNGRWAKKEIFYLEQQDIKLVWKLLELLLQNVKD